MNNDPRIKIDPLNRKISFGDGDCDKARDVCQALCCRMYDVTISEEEFLSGNYKARPVCQASKEECSNPETSCVNRLFQLLKKHDGSCVYLGVDNKCSIHGAKPGGCNDFDCREGWSISWAYLSGMRKEREYQDRTRKYYISKTVKDDMVFLPNPIVKLKAAFSRQASGGVSIVKEPLDMCRPYPGILSISTPGIDDRTIETLLGLFDDTRDLAAVRKELKAKTGRDIAAEDLYEVAWALFKEGLIVFRHCVSGFKHR